MFELIQGVHQNSIHFVFCNFSAPLTAWIKRKDNFEMPFKFSIGKCPKTLSELTIWPRYGQKCEDNLKLKSTFSRIFNKRSLWMMEGSHGSWCVIMAKRGVCKVTGIVFRCREDANHFKNIFDHFGGQNCQF